MELQLDVIAWRLQQRSRRSWLLFFPICGGFAAVRQTSAVVLSLGAFFFSLAALVEGI
ncbi:MAG: hypothetical protein ABSH00_04350 [Bryobacteraceae bacterium]